MSSWKDRGASRPWDAEGMKQRAEKMAEEYKTACGIMGVKIDQALVEEIDHTQDPEAQAKAAYQQQPGCDCELTVQRIAQPETGITVLAVGHTDACSLNRIHESNPPEAA